MFLMQWLNISFRFFLNQTNYIWYDVNKKLNSVSEHVCFPPTYIQGFHIFMVLSLPVFRESGEDRVLCDLTPMLCVQPVSQQVLGILQ